MKAIYVLPVLMMSACTTPRSDPVQEISQEISETETVIARAISAPPPACLRAPLGPVEAAAGDDWRVIALENARRVIVNAAALGACHAHYAQAGPDAQAEEAASDE